MTSKNYKKSSQWEQEMLILSRRRDPVGAFPSLDRFAYLVLIFTAQERVAGLIFLNVPFHCMRDPRGPVH